MKRELRIILKKFFGFKTINRIDIENFTTLNNEWIIYTIKIWTRNKNNK